MRWADLAFSLRTWSNMGLTLPELELSIRFLDPAGNFQCNLVTKYMRLKYMCHLDSVTNVTKFSDQLLMLEKYSFYISFYIDKNAILKTPSP